MDVHAAVIPFFKNIIPGKQVNCGVLFDVVGFTRTKMHVLQPA
jgi:hypothetical protein